LGRIHKSIPLIITNYQKQKKPNEIVLTIINRK